MTTLQDRPNTALLVIDMQNGVVGAAYDVKRVTANVNVAIDKAREAKVDVVWVQHNAPGLDEGSDDWAIVAELERVESEPLVQKRYADSFDDTDLESLLAELAVGRLVITGAQTDECIRSTLHGAVVRGYDAVLVGDAHTTEDLSAFAPGAPGPAGVIAFTNLYWDGHRAPGRTGGVLTAA